MGAALALQFLRTNLVYIKTERSSRFFLIFFKIFFVGCMMVKVDTKLLIKQIELYCASNGISKSEFYERTGISSATVSQWRKGLYAPSARSIKAIEDHLGMPIEALLYGHPSDTVTMLQQLRDEDRALLDVAKRMTPEQVKMMTEFAKSLKGETN